MGSKTNSEGCITIGPWGGSQGKTWIYRPKDCIIKKISIAHGKLIHSISFQNSFFGAKGGIRIDTIHIDYPNEYLTSISGTYGTLKHLMVLKSLCFGTNKKHHGPYGSDTGTRFSYEGKDGVIVGFHGCVHRYLDAIGIYVMPESLVFGRNSSKKENNPSPTPQLNPTSISSMAIPREAGPWGFCGGKPWDDGVFSAVKKVRLHIGESLKVICAMQFEYVKSNGTSFLSPMHGGGTCADHMELVSVVNLEFADEYLTGISGFYGPVEGYKGLKAITSITFLTNKMKYGPYGEQNGAGYTYFTSISSPAKVVGFHGWNAGFLSAIGVHMEYS